MATDRVHLSPEDYWDLAAAIMEVAQGGLEGEDGNDDNLSKLLALKCRRLESVDTLPRARGKSMVATERQQRDQSATGSWLTDRQIKLMQHHKWLCAPAWSCMAWQPGWMKMLVITQLTYQCV